MVFGVLALAGHATRASAQTPALARVTGTAFDSVAMRPLSNALVQLVSTTDPSRVRSATSDARGAYLIDSVPAGTYLLGFLHGRLDSLSLETPLLRIDVRTAGDIQANVAVPSARTIIERACGPNSTRDSLGLFMGVVRSARGTALSAPARVRAQWNEVRLGERGLERSAPSLVAATTDAGHFAICGVPTDGTFFVRAFVGADSSGFVEMDASNRRLLVRDLYIGSARRAITRANGALPPLFGAGALRGVIRTATGQPIREARVQIWGSGREDTTNASGQFSMEQLPAGSYTLEARAIGMTPKRAVVDIPEGAEASMELAMDVFVPALDTVRVRADRNARDDLQDFERRRRSGGGYFIDEAQLNRRRATYMSDILRMTPGIVILPSTIGNDRVHMRSSGTSPSCAPTIFLNGSQVFNDDGNLDTLVDPQEIRAIEVYTRTGSLPAQFQSLNGCGTIVIWTGARRQSPPGR